MDGGTESPLFGLNQRLPPSNVQAEQALLGACLANNKALDKVGDLEPEHFSDPIHGRIFEEIRKQVSDGHVADAVLLKTTFEHAGVLDEVGGVAYLTQLLTAMVSISGVSDYARAIRDTWVRRQLIDISAGAVEMAFGADSDMDGNGAVTNAVEKLLALGDTSSDKRGTTTFASLAKGASERSEAAQRGDVGHAGLHTGIASIDKLWGGLWPGELYYLMARSRTGKTPLMMQIARHVGLRLNQEAEAQKTPRGHVHIFSLEMTAENLVTTNLASTTKWTAEQIKSGQIDDWIEFDRAAKRLGELPIVIDDQADMDLPTLYRRAMAAKRQRHTRLICIDFRELVRRGKEHSRMQLPEWIPYLGYALKALSKTIGVPVIALAQINKTKSGEAPVRPTLDDLPYDGGQAADAVFALHRPELYLSTEPPRLNPALGDEKRNAAMVKWEDERKEVANLCEFMALKKRFGPTGNCRLRFNGPRMLLTEWNEQAPPDGMWPDYNEGDQQ